MEAQCLPPWLTEHLNQEKDNLLSPAAKWSGVQGLSFLLPFFLMLKPNFLFLMPNQHLNDKFRDVSLLQV